MRKTLTALATAMLLSGCALLDLIEIPPPDPPQPDPPPAVSWSVTPAWERIDLPKAISMEAHDGAIFLSVANVYHGENRSEVYRDGRRIYSATVETLTLWQHGAALYATPEHGRYVRRWDGATFAPSCPVAGRWSVAGIGRTAFFNDDYRGGLFHDHPVCIDVASGSVVGEIPATAMPRSAVEYGAGYAVSANFGREVLAVGTPWGGWEIHESPGLTLAVLDGRLYAGGGMRAGPAIYKEPDGRIYQWQGGDRWTTLHDTGSYGVMAAVVLRDGILWVSVDPDRLTWIDAAGHCSQVYQRPGLDSRADHVRGDKDRSFGAAGCRAADGSIYVAWSDRRDFVEVYRVLRQ